MDPNILQKTTTLREIDLVISSFKKKKMQFLQLAHSDATSSVQMGSVTGSVKCMAASPDFLEVFKHAISHTSGSGGSNHALKMEDNGQQQKSVYITN